MAFTDILDINTRPYVRHPIYWILWKKYTDTGEEKKTFEWTNAYDEIMGVAEENNGCARFWDPGEAPHVLNQYLDVACLVNEEARPILKSIYSIAPDVKVMDFASR